MTSVTPHFLKLLSFTRCRFWLRKLDLLLRSRLKWNQSLRWACTAANYGYALLPGSPRAGDLRVSVGIGHAGKQMYRLKVIS